MKKNNFFTSDYYDSILKSALENGFEFLTMREFFVDPSAHRGKIAVLRHDIDAKPLRTELFLKIEEKYKIRSSNFLLVHDINYNPFAVNVHRMFKKAAEMGAEIGLHSNYVETASILNLDPIDVLEAEILALRSHHDIHGIACHRSVDFMANSLPHLIENWNTIKMSFGLEYQAYDGAMMNELEFVNEGLNPHLGWRNRSPEEVIAEGKSFCLSTHPHWWHRDYAFED